MFGLSLRIVESGTQLMITDPISPVGVIVVGFFVLSLALPSLLYVLLGKTSFSGAIGRLVVCAVLVLLLGVMLEHSRIILNGDTNSATIDQTFLYRHTQRVIPLSDIDHAQVANSYASGAVQLILTDGRVLQLSSFTQQGNQQAAAMAINRFLQSHSEGESSSN